MPDDMSAHAPAGDAIFEPKHGVKELNDRAREFFLRVADDPELYKRYLKTIAKFPSYSAMNAVRIHEAAPDATQVRDLEAWNKLGCTVKGKESGIPITHPEYDAKARKTFFKVKYLFAEHQVNGAVKASKGYDERFLEQAFELVETAAPTTPEGKYIVGQHFGIGGYLKDGALPPADLLAVDKVEEACGNIKDYVDEIRKSSYAFIRAVEGAYKGLAAEDVREKNAGLFKSLKRSAEREAVELRPKEELSTFIAEGFGEDSVVLPDAPKTSSWKPEAGWRAPGAEYSVDDLDHAEEVAEGVIRVNSTMGYQHLSEDELAQLQANMNASARAGTCTGVSAYTFEGWEQKGDAAASALGAAAVRSENDAAKASADLDAKLDAAVAAAEAERQSQAQKDGRAAVKDEQSK